MSRAELSIKRRRNRWRKPIRLTVNGGRAEGWAYVSKSGKTVEVYISPLDASGDPLLDWPPSVKVSIPRIQRWVGLDP